MYVRDEDTAEVAGVLYGGGVAFPVVAAFGIVLGTDRDVETVSDRGSDVVNAEAAGHGVGGDRDPTVFGFLSCAAEDALGTVALQEALTFEIADWLTLKEPYFTCQLNFSGGEWTSLSHRLLPLLMSRIMSEVAMV